MGNLIENARGLAMRNAGLAAAVGLSLLASFLINLPEALEGFYRLIAVIGGLTGYWASSAPLGRLKLMPRIGIALLVIILIAVAVLYLRWYFDQSLTSLFHDGLALVAYAASFAAACFFMGLCGVSVVTPPVNEAKG